MKKSRLPRFSLRTTAVILIDLLLISLSFFVFYYYNEQVLGAHIINVPVIPFMFCYVCIYLLCIALFGGYSKKTLSRLSVTVFSLLLSTVLFCAVTLLIYHFLGARFMISLAIYSVISFSFLTCARILQKLALERFKLRPKLGNLKPALIIGAGFSGKMIYRELVEASSEYTPVCFVDDDEALIGRTICGLNVYGPSVLIPELVKKYRIELVVLAIPSISDEARNRILSCCESLQCKISVLPSLDALIKNQNFFKQAHPVDIPQLLGRKVIDLHNNAIAQNLVRGKTCLITGGGGSIGSELCRQIITLNPKHICILDIYENNAYDIQQELLQNGYSKEQVTVEIASVRDYEKLNFLFNIYRFDIVFHAAAHKHVPLMEDNPEEAVKNNILGTYNVAVLAQKYQVQNMLLISTDKAVNPTNVMGATKRVCEMVLQYLSQLPENHVKFSMVRFGNVLGSNGSVIPLFAKQIEKGGPVTVTHPDIIRYFMTIPEAVSLVIEAAAIAKGGEVFVLDMGEPVKIVSLAENLIKMYGYTPYQDIDIEFCGLRPGEKLYEELLMHEEGLSNTENQKIFIDNIDAVDNVVFEKQLHKLFSLAGHNCSAETISLLHEMIPTYQKPNVCAAPHNGLKNREPSASTCES